MRASEPEICEPVENQPTTFSLELTLACNCAIVWCCWTSSETCGGQRERRAREWCVSERKGGAGAGSRWLFCRGCNAYLIVAFTMWDGVAASDIYGAVSNSPKEGAYDTVLIFVSSDECIAYCEQHNRVHLDIVFSNA